MAAVERIDTLYEQGTAITGVPTGFYELDNKTSGLQRGDLIIVAGRPSMGKHRVPPQPRHGGGDQGEDSPVVQHGHAGEGAAMRMIASLGGIYQHRRELQACR